MQHPIARNAHLLLLLIPFLAQAQYTEVINSNRPGLSNSAYALGSNVYQVEFGLSYEQRDHALLNTDSNVIGVDLALRYGLYFETLELIYEGTFVRQDLTRISLGTSEIRQDFTRNRAGLKLLVFDPFKNPERNKPNLYSWRANNVFQWRNLLPAVSLYGGATFNLGDNPFYPEDPVFTYRGMIATQSKLTPKMVLIGNFSYDRIGSDFPEMGYLVSLSHSLRNPRWSVFIENQGIQSDRYSDVLLRTGFAHLFNPNFQVDFQLGASFKTTPSRVFVTSGLSYRIDRHQDRLRKVRDDNKANNRVRKRDAKRARKRNRKKRGSDF